MTDPIKIPITAIDRFSAPFKKISERIRQVTRPLRQVQNALAAIGREAGLKRLAEAARNAGGKFRGLLGEVKGLAGALALLGGGAVGAFKREVLDTAAEFERFKTILKTVEGSVEKADASFAWISDFAVKTPYELAQVTDAFVKLKAYGLNPTDGLLQTLGDTASAMGKDMDQAVEAVADAVTGENERLKEFGIKARKVGRDFVYEYTSNGQTVTKKARANSREQIQATLQAIWNEKYAGAMEDQSKTWNGLMSNLSDQWTRFKSMVMDSGPFQILKDKLAGFLASIDAMAASGELKAWAEYVGGILSEAIKGIGEAIKSAWEAGKNLVAWVKKTRDRLKPFIDRVGGLNLVLMGLGGLVLVKVLPSLVALAGAIGALSLPILALTGVGAVMYLAWKKNWGGMRDWAAKKAQNIRWIARDVIRRLSGIKGGVKDVNAELAEGGDVSGLERTSKRITEIIEKLKAEGQGFKSGFSEYFDSVVITDLDEGFKSLGDSVKMVVKGFEDFFKFVLGDDLSTTTDDWNKGGEILGKTAAGPLVLLAAAFRGVTDATKESLSFLDQYIAALMRGDLDAAGKVVMEHTTGLREAFEGLWITFKEDDLPRLWSVDDLSIPPGTLQQIKDDWKALDPAGTFREMWKAAKLEIDGWATDIKEAFKIDLGAEARAMIDSWIQALDETAGRALNKAYELAGKIKSLFGGSSETAGDWPAGIPPMDMVPAHRAPMEMVPAHRARGGPVSAGKGYFVGEEGAELFTPSQSGRIIPYNRLFGPPLGASSLLSGHLSAARQQPANAHISVDFSNLPRGTKVKADKGKGVDLDLTRGYAMVTP